MLYNKLNRLFRCWLAQNSRIFFLQHSPLECVTPLSRFFYCWFVGLLDKTLQFRVLNDYHMQFTRSNVIICTSVTCFANILVNRMEKIRMMVGFGLILCTFERITNSKIDLVDELCYTDMYINNGTKLSNWIKIVIRSNAFCWLLVRSFCFTPNWLALAPSVIVMSCFCGQAPSLSIF